MNLGNELYFLHPFISNSDLLRQLPAAQFTPDLTRAFAEGTLLDAMETTAQLVDFLNYRIFGYDYSFSREQFDTSKRMRDSLRSDKFYQDVKAQCAGQQEFYKRSVVFESNDFSFTLDCRIKYDLWSFLLGWGADIKTTSATSLDGFIKAISSYHYDQQRAFYMHVADATKDVLFGVSKTWPYRVFVIRIKKGDDLFLSGMQKVHTLAYQHLLRA